VEIKFEHTITGSHVILRKVTLEDAEVIFGWRTSNSGRFLRQPEGYNLEMQKSWIKSRKADEINYIIQDKNTGESVGMVAIYNLNVIDQIAEVGRLLLSDKYLGKSNPFGLEALLLTYDYVLNKMNFRKISGIVASSNSAMVKLQLFLGMKEEGYFKKHIWLADGFEDVHFLSIFQDEFNQFFKTRIQFLLKNFK
jgi:RimJ/RimL family protein N-acetyltransferase